MQRAQEAEVRSVASELRIAICDDWEQCALSCADWAELQQLADVQFFPRRFNPQKMRSADWQISMQSA